jgi:hypothetical protein
MVFIMDDVGFFTVQDDLGTVKARGRLDLAYRVYVKSSNYKATTRLFPSGADIDATKDYVANTDTEK